MFYIGSMLASWARESARTPAERAVYSAAGLIFNTATTAQNVVATVKTFQIARSDINSVIETTRLNREVSKPTAENRVA